jgi:lysyl endopeptidase
MTDATHRIVLTPPSRAELNAPRPTGKGQPLQVGFGRSLSAEQRRVPLSRLRWSPMKSTGYAATISVQSPGATSLRVSGQLSRNVPGLQIAFRNATKVVAVIAGSALNTSEPYWSPVIDGDTIVLELRAPAPIQDSTLLELPQVSHLP